MEQLCKIRELYRAISEFESLFIEVHDLTLNEGMLLCCLDRFGKSSAREIANKLNISASNTSKIIKNVEDKELISRLLCKEDKRQMYFELTRKGKIKVDKINKNTIQEPSPLKEIFERLNGDCTYSSDNSHNN